jgi:hypothetical protein
MITISEEALQAAIEGDLRAGLQGALQAAAPIITRDARAEERKNIQLGILAQAHCLAHDNPTTCRKCQAFAEAAQIAANGGTHTIGSDTH